MLSAVLVFAICCPYLSCLRFHPVPLCLCPKPYNLVSLDLSVKGASALDVQSYLSDQYDIHTDLYMVRGLGCSFEGLGFRV